MRTDFGMVKINLRQSTIVYSIIGLIILLVIASDVTTMIIFGLEESYTIAIGNYLYLLPVLMAISIPAMNYSRLINLGGDRKDFFSSSILTYVIVITTVTIINIVFHFTIDRILLTKVAGLIDLLDVFGFMVQGPIVAFFQMWAFLFLFCCVLHTLTLVQGRWYGWVVNISIIAIISIFTPIAPLRSALVWFFNMIIFHDIAIIQILSCLVLGLAVYYTSLIPIKSKQI